MNLKIFDVEHGACALLTCDNGTRLMIDCGHNASTSWRPGTYLKNNQVSYLEKLAITNYDEDHVSGFDNLLGNVHVQWLSRNKSVSGNQIQQLKSEDGMGLGIAGLIDAIANVFNGDPTKVASPVFQGLVETHFWNSYPEFDDENNLSLVLHLSCNGIGVLFPGDLERVGWLKLLERDSFQQALRNTHVLIASHHGRESGCCEEIFNFCKPFFVVISDKGYMYDTQKTVPFYRKFTRGGRFRDELERHVLTTRRDGMIEFYFNSDGWGTL